MIDKSISSAAPLISAALAFGGMLLSAYPVSAQTIPVFEEPSSCSVPPESVQVCQDGAFGNDAPESFNSLGASDVDLIVRAAARSLSINTLTIAVVDRAGRVAALFRQPNADPANDEIAVGVARTAAFFSHNMAPLSSRTVRFISGTHFPPGVMNTGNAALYGIENTNRGCTFNVEFNEGKCVPRARSINGRPCDPFDTSGCGNGITTGKRQPDDGPYPQEPESLSNAEARPVNAGGVPLYRLPLSPAEVSTLLETGRVPFRGKVVGAIGVVGAPPEHPEWAEFAAAQGAFGAELTGLIVPVPVYPLPFPGNVIIDGIRLPLFSPLLKLTFTENGLPNGIRQLEGTTAGTSADGTYEIGPFNGGCLANEYLAGPKAGGALSRGDVELIIRRAIAAAKRTRGAIRLPLNSYARMAIAVSDLDGNILGLYRMPDATVFSIDVAVAKARNVVYFSGPDPGVRLDLPGVPAGAAVTNRTLGFGSQALYPPGIDSLAFNRHLDPGPFYESLFIKDLENVCSQGSQLRNRNQSGIVFFPGATPLYRNGQMIGGFGISGDGVEQDDYVTFLGAGGLPEEKDLPNFLPDKKMWADRHFIGGARLPMFKFPRQPEGVRECNGKKCG